MSEIARIIDLDNLSTRSSHFITEAPLHHTMVSNPSLPAASHISSSHSMDYSRNRALACARDSESDYHETKICSAGIQRLPTNHRAHLATFTANEQLKVIKLLRSHSDYLSYDLLTALDENNFNKIIRALLTTLTTYSKYMILPFHLPDGSQLRLKTSTDCQVTLITPKPIDIPSLSNIYLDLELQILSRSTFLQLSPIVKNSELFIQKLSSCSVTAKHQFKSIYLHNTSHHNICIPQDYALFGIEGLTNQPNNAGDIFQLKNLTSILELPSKSKLFTPQDNQLYCDKEEKFIITCEHFLLSSFCAQDMAPDMSY
jgi:hypothetical protein